MQGIGANGGEAVVLEMEHRRKSGRGVREWYCLPTGRNGDIETSVESSAARKREVVTLLEDRPEYRGPEGEKGNEVSDAQANISALS